MGDEHKIDKSRFNENEVIANKIGDAVTLMPEGSVWFEFLKSFDIFSESFMSDGREQLEVQEREAL